MKLRRKLSSFQIIIIGFAAVILLGSLLLMLPFATRDGRGASFFDSLFTATSAVCVTGLVVKDTALYWSGFGQAIILILIQIGGMGVVTLTVAFAMAAGKKINLKERSTLREAISAPDFKGLVKLNGFIILGILIFELIGALVMMPSFIKAFGAGKGIWYSIFHSVSAFCNAGFDLMGERGEFSSLTSFAYDPLVNIPVMLLIIIGGIGFVTWDDIRKNKWRFSRYRMQSKVVLTTTAILIFVPTLYYFFFEFGDLPFGKRLLVSLFQSVTPRTAGFNTVNLTAISEAGLTLMMALMLIGGSPGSTAGGMKTTTVAVLFANAFSVFRRKEQPQFFRRRAPEGIVRSAATIFILYLVLFLLGGLIISKVENLPILSCLFETASAIGTVGLTLGITPELGALSRCILILLMFFGRVGGLTLIFATLPGVRHNGAQLPQEKLTVG